MKVSLIVAAAENGVIGKDNDLIWHLPKDMRFFKDTTLNHHVIMGRKNFESIPHKYSPLPNRINIVITRQANYSAKGCLTVNSIEEALKISRKNKDQEPFIIGGGEIYKLALEKKLVDKIYLTKIHQTFSCFCSNFCKNPNFSTFFIEFCTDLMIFSRYFAEHSRKC